MALIPDGREVDTVTGANRFAKDTDGLSVVVSVSHEAFTDLGWRTVWQAAERKYARNEFAVIENTRLVRVEKADCEV